MSSLFLQTRFKIEDVLNIISTFFIQLFSQYVVSIIDQIFTEYSWPAQTVCQFGEILCSSVFIKKIPIKH